MLTIFTATALIISIALLILTLVQEIKDLFPGHVYFDMDGTIADLYTEDINLDEVFTREERIFQNLKPLVNPIKLNAEIAKLTHKGYTVGVITWLPAGASAEYRETCKADKLEWTKKHFPELANNFHALPFGTPKARAIKTLKVATLVDDNPEVLRNFKAINRKTLHAKQIHKIANLAR